ncbi:DUF4435 domain-containing protein, partial [bacterium]|nr:DUF4435 domain-containing protein [bacterium]
RRIIKGKDGLLIQARDNENFVGITKLICVDSDYHFLIPNSDYANIIRRRRPYIFQTYTYAIENYKCLAESLECICVDATYNDRNDFDFAQFMKEYSKAIYELFVYSLFNKWKALDLPISCSGNVAIGDCLTFEDNGKKTIAAISEKAKKAIEDANEILKSKYPDFQKDINRLKRRLAKRGVRPENVYLVMDAHTLFTGVVSPILQKAIGKPKRERHKEITAVAEIGSVDNPTHSKWHDSYNKMTLDPVALLEVNKAHFYHDCLPLKCIERDIKRYLEMHLINLII